MGEFPEWRPATLLGSRGPMKVIRLNRHRFNSAPLLWRGGVTSARRRAVNTWPVTAALACGPLVDVVHYVLSARGVTLGLFTVAQVLRGVLCLALGAMLLRYRLTAPPKVRRFLLPLLVLVALAVVTAPLSFWPLANIVYAMRVALLLCLFWSVALLWAKGFIGGAWMTRMGWLILLSVLVSQIGGWLSGASYYGLPFELPGLGSRPSLPGAWLAAVVPMFLWRGQLRLIDGLGLSLVVCSSVATLRRSSIVAVVFAVLAATLTSALHRRRAGRLVATCAAIGLVSYIAVTATGLASGLRVRFEDLDVTAGGTASGRTRFMRVALTHIVSRGITDNLFGEGVGAVLPVTAQEFGAAVGSHNEWLDTWIGFGVPGLILLAWMHVEVLRLLGSVNTSNKRAVAACFVVLLTLGNTAGGIFDPTSAPLFAVLGAAAAHASLRFRTQIGWPGDSTSSCASGGRSRLSRRGPEGAGWNLAQAALSRGS